MSRCVAEYSRARSVSTTILLSTVGYIEQCNQSNEKTNAENESSFDGYVIACRRRDPMNCTPVCILDNLDQAGLSSQPITTNRFNRSSPLSQNSVRFAMDDDDGDYEDEGDEYMSSFNTRF